MPPSFLLLFPEGTWKTIYGYGRELAVDVGTLLLEQGHVFAVGRATRYALLSLFFFPSAYVFSARDALQQHAGQLWEALERADFPSLKNMLGQTALLAGEALMFHAGAHLLEKTVIFFSGFKRRWFIRSM
jgi:hypothetical protein